MTFRRSRRSTGLGSAKFAATALTIAVTLALTSLPLLAAEEAAAPDPAEMPVGTLFRWLNFLLVFGGIGYMVVKLGAPYFRGNARQISGAIKQATETRAAAERELREAEQRTAALNLTIQDLRRAAVQESAKEAERLRALARTESEKISRSASAEIEATERAGRQELRAIAARLATARAAELIRAEMNPATEEALFQAFVGELQRTAQ
jgi:F0F1-type ATP synthase membrane subunit b/b'